MTGSPKSQSTPIISNKPSSTINIKRAVPLVLDLDRMNYDIWRELFELHCVGYGVANHLEPPSEIQDASSSDITEYNRGMRPKTTLLLFLEISLLSLLGVTLTLNMYFASLRCTSPTFVASMINTIACLTFIIAVSLRLEVIDLKNPQGMAKVVGTLVSLAGVMTMTLYKGPTMRTFGHPAIHFSQTTSIQENWFKGSVLTVASCVTWSMWYIMQAYTLQRYPAQLSLTTWMSFLGGAQSAIFTAVIEHKSAAWSIGFDIDLWSTIYGGIVVSGLIVYIQLWCTKEKGPVFVTMFNPLSTLLVAVLSYFVLDEKLYMGSIVGGAVVIIGLYLLLWGKEGDKQEDVKKIQHHDVTYEVDQEDPK